MPEEKYEFRTVIKYQNFFKRIDRLLMWMAPTPDEESMSSILTTGERADLRRMNPAKDKVRPPVFWKLLCAYEIIGSAESPEKGTGRNKFFSLENEKNWAAVFQGMATTASVCRGASEDFGKAMGSIEDAGDALSQRFDLLMRAEGDRFLDLLRYTLKLARSKNCSFSWKKLACLCVATDESDRSRVQSDLIKSFYLARWKAKHTNNENTELIAKEND